MTAQVTMGENLQYFLNNEAHLEQRSKKEIIIRKMTTSYKELCLITGRYMFELRVTIC